MKPRQLEAAWLAVIFLTALPVYSQEIQVRFRVNRTYQDKDMKCFGASARGQLLFFGKIENGIATDVQLQNYPEEWPYLTIYRSLKLSAVEMQGLQFFQDNLGKWWVTRLSLTESSLRWVLYESGNYYSFCALPQSLETVTPSGLTFEFEVQGLLEGIWLAESNTEEVCGMRKDGGSFSGTLQFTQMPYQGS